MSGGGGEGGLLFARLTTCAVTLVARRSNGVALENGMTTGLLPVTICLPGASLSQHMRVRPCPCLTASRGTRLGERTTGRGENKVADKDGGLQGEREQPERSAGVYQRAKTGDIHRGRRSDSTGSGTRKRKKQNAALNHPSCLNRDV